MKIRFGKFKAQEFMDIPPWYLSWVYENVDFCSYFDESDLEELVLILQCYSVDISTLIRKIKPLKPIWQKKNPSQKSVLGFHPDAYRLIGGPFDGLDLEIANPKVFMTFEEIHVYELNAEDRSYSYVGQTKHEVVRNRKKKTK